MTTPPIPITLSGRPVTAALDPDALPRYLAARGWVERPVSEASPIWRTFDREQHACSIPRTEHWPSLAIAGPRVADAIERLARIEHRHPLDLLADLLPPSSAPVAWAHLSERQRALTLSIVETQANKAKSWAGKCRAAGDDGLALVNEGEAAALLALADLGRRAL